MYSCAYVLEYNIVFFFFFKFGIRCIWVQRTEDLQPLCFYPDGYGYAYQEVRKTSNGYHLDLERTTQKKMFGEEVDFISLQVYFETEKRLRLKVNSKTYYAYEICITYIFMDSFLIVNGS